MLVLSEPTVMALMLRKQHLAADFAAAEVLPVMDDLLGLHATLPTSPYLQLHARMQTFDSTQLDGLLDAGRAAKLPAMRRTLFIESAALVPLVFAATRQLNTQERDRFLAANGLTAQTYERLAHRVELELAGQSLSARQLREALAHAERLSPILTVMCDEGRLVRWRGLSGWPSAQPTYRRFDEVLPGARIDEWDERAAVVELVNRYIGRYGPVTVSDVAWWTGLRKATVRDAIESLPDLLTVGVDGWPDGYVMHAADAHDAQRHSAAPAGAVSLLPVLDPYLQGYRDRSRCVEPRHYRLVVDLGGNATSAILVDGRVVGLWDFVPKPAPQLQLLIFDSPRAAVRRRVRAAADEVAAFLGDGRASVVEVDSVPTPSEWLMSPLRPRRHD